MLSERLQYLFGNANVSARNHKFGILLIFREGYHDNNNAEIKAYAGKRGKMIPSCKGSSSRDSNRRLQK